MAIKQLGHYEGVIEDIDFKSLKFKMLDERHKQLINLSTAKQNLSNQIKSIDEQIEQLRSDIEIEVKSGLIDWAWIWIKKSGRVKWKQEFINALGRNKAKEISKAYKTKEHPQIGVKFIDPIQETIIQTKDNPRKFPVTKHRLSKVA